MRVSKFFLTLGSMFLVAVELGMLVSHPSKGTPLPQAGVSVGKREDRVDVARGGGSNT